MTNYAPNDAQFILGNSYSTDETVGLPNQFVLTTTPSSGNLGTYGNLILGRGSNTMTMNLALNLGSLAQVTGGGLVFRSNSGSTFSTGSLTSTGATLSITPSGTALGLNLDVISNSSHQNVLVNSNSSTVYEATQLIFLNGSNTTVSVSQPGGTTGPAYVTVNAIGSGGSVTGINSPDGSIQVSGSVPTISLEVATVLPGSYTIKGDMTIGQSGTISPGGLTLLGRTSAGYTIDLGASGGNTGPLNMGNNGIIGLQSITNAAANGSGGTGADAFLNFPSTSSTNQWAIGSPSTGISLGLACVGSNAINSGAPGWIPSILQTVAVPSSAGYIPYTSGTSGQFGLLAPSGTNTVLTWNGSALVWGAATGGGVTQLFAGTNITLSPSNGLGNVTITASGGGGGGISSVTGQGDITATTTSGAVTVGISNTLSQTYSFANSPVFNRGMFLDSNPLTSPTGNQCAFGTIASGKLYIQCAGYNSGASVNPLVATDLTSVANQLVFSTATSGSTSDGSVSFLDTPGNTGTFNLQYVNGGFAWNAPSGGGSLTVTDGTTSVAGTTNLTFSGATVSGTTPNATVTITGGSGVPFYQNNIKNTTSIGTAQTYTGLINNVFLTNTTIPNFASGFAATGNTIVGSLDTTGSSTGQYQVDSSYNTFFGFDAGPNVGVLGFNTCIGSGVYYGPGQQNTCVGNSILQGTSQNTSSSNNVMMGYNLYATGALGTNNNIALGNNQTGLGTAYNNIILGNNITLSSTTQSNTVILGNAYAGGTKMSVGINNLAPQFDLDIGISTTYSSTIPTVPPYPPVPAICMRSNAIVTTPIAPPNSFVMFPGTTGSIGSPFIGFPQMTWQPNTGPAVTGLVGLLTGDLVPNSVMFLNSNNAIQCITQPPQIAGAYYLENTYTAGSPGTYAVGWRSSLNALPPFQTVSSPNQTLNGSVAYIIPLLGETANVLLPSDITVGEQIIVVDYNTGFTTTISPPSGGSILWFENDCNNIIFGNEVGASVTLLCVVAGDSPQYSIISSNGGSIGYD